MMKVEEFSRLIEQARHAKPTKHKIFNDIMHVRVTNNS